MLPEGDGVNGAVIHIADLYTGNPSFDFVPPAKPQSVTAIPGQYLNAVVWDDVPGEAGETYDVYASEVAFTDELKSPSYIACIPAATRIASVPVPSSGA